MSGSSYPSTAEYKLRHAATVVNITKDAGGSPPVYAAHSLPSRFARSVKIKEKLDNYNYYGYAHYIQLYSYLHYIQCI